MSRISASARALADELHADQDMAWVWHCNIVGACRGDRPDSLPVAASFKRELELNEIAARVMLQLFGIDVKALPQWKQQESTLTNLALVEQLEREYKEIAARFEGYFEFKPVT